MADVSVTNLAKLAELIKRRNEIDKRISEIIDRPAEKGHISEYIASQLFPIKLNKSRSKSGYDGIFTDGDLSGKKVDIKFYAKNEHSIDLNSKVDRDTYLLVFTGPYQPASSSKGKVRPFHIDKIYLFNEMELCDKLANRVKIGTATSVKSEYWNGKEIYPENQLNIDLKLRVQELILLTEKVNQPDL
jgi:hypothetical protein